MKPIVKVLPEATGASLAALPSTPPVFALGQPARPSGRRASRPASASAWDDGKRREVFIGSFLNWCGTWVTNGAASLADHSFDKVIHGLQLDGGLVMHDTLGNHDAAGVVAERPLERGERPAEELRLRRIGGA